jgi:hypothetical protein
MSPMLKLQYKTLKINGYSYIIKNGGLLSKVHLHFCCLSCDFERTLHACTQMEDEESKVMFEKLKVVL